MLTRPIFPFPRTSGSLSIAALLAAPGGLRAADATPERRRHRAGRDPRHRHQPGRGHRWIRRLPRPPRRERLPLVTGNSQADILNSVPTIKAEGGGGEVATNVFIKGLPSGGQYQFTPLMYDGMPVFSSFGLNSSAFDVYYRNDLGIERLEFVRGGVSNLFGPGSVAGLINYISQDGQRHARGDGAARGRGREPRARRLRNERPVRTRTPTCTTRSPASIATTKARSRPATRPKASSSAAT